MKILLVYPPFCTPTIMPYSISHLKNLIIQNSEFDVKCLDLNVKFHRMKFRGITDLDELNSCTGKVYSQNNKKVVNGKEPELIEEILGLIKRENADYIGFSIVYNSQNFYTKALIDRLENCFVGGPAISPIFPRKDMFKELDIKVSTTEVTPDFSDYEKKDYYSKELIIPLKTSSGCFYKNCTFCYHHQNENYNEHKLVFPNGKYYFFIDDMISTKRMIEISKKINGKWWVQLRPTKDLIPYLDDFHKRGLHTVAWGVETGSQKVLDDMKKGTNLSDISKVLEASKKAGIINIAYIMFGFPTETKEDFLETIEFLTANSENIDVVSTTVFGVHKGSYIYNNSEEFGIRIQHEKRTILDDKITFTGLRYDVAKLRKGYAKTINKINKLPKFCNYMKEQTLFINDIEQ